MRAIAGLTLREMLRRRATLTLAIAVLAFIALSGWAFHALVHSYGPAGEARLYASEQLVFVMLVFSGMLALTASFLSASAISPELESGVAISLLARPLTRSGYVLGKWLGLAALVACFSLLSGALELLVAFWSAGFVPPDPLAALAALGAQALVLMTLGLWLSTRLSSITAAILSVALFFLAWMAGVGGALGVALHNSTLQVAGAVSQLAVPTNGLWQAAEYYLEPPSVVAILHLKGIVGADPFVAASPEPTAFYIWCALWVAGVAGAAVWSLRRRDF